jgi:hypothetical protein
LEKKLKDQTNLNFSNSLMFARIQEINLASNRVKEDRVVVNGIRIKPPLLLTLGQGLISLEASQRKFLNKFYQDSLVRLCT